MFMPPYSRYEVHQSYLKSILDAFSRLGIKCKVFQLINAPFKEFYEQTIADPPDFTFAFNGILPDANNTFLSDIFKIRHFAYLTFPLHHYFALTKSKYSIISCIDSTECDLLRQQHFDKSLFLPTGIDKKFIAKESEESEKIYDVLFLTSFTDASIFPKYWEKQYGAKFSQLVQDAADHFLQDHRLTYFQTFLLELKKFESQGYQIKKEVNFLDLLGEMENFIRGKERLNLLKGIKQAQVHIVGENSDKWLALLEGQKNITAHPLVNYEGTFKLIKQSKIVLNSSPYIKNGGHDRVFAGMACGATVLTNKNNYLRDHFKEKKDILFYHYPFCDEDNDLLNYYLKHDKKRLEIGLSGKDKVKNHHTWDHRALQLVTDLAKL